MFKGPLLRVETFNLKVIDEKPVEYLAEDSVLGQVYDFCSMWDNFSRISYTWIKYFSGIFFQKFYLY